MGDRRVLSEGGPIDGDHVVAAARRFWADPCHPAVVTRNPGRYVVAPNSIPGGLMLTMRTVALPAVVAIAALLATACGPAAGPYGASPPASAPRGVPTVALAGSPLGNVLVDGAGRTVYLFERDTSMVSTCSGACASVWPPVLTSAPPTGGAFVSGGDLGTTSRRDRTMQVTYHGHPLYRFAGDRRPGEVTGQGLDAFGARWYVVGADGTAITSR
jgi:predicted lipoprotein with Yx(FWY)xxD motif